MIEKITYDIIYPIWESYLWYNRTSAITPASAMNYKGGYHMDNLNYSPTFFGYFENNNLMGVNSGHKCRDGSYRSRGLYVHQSFRKNGVATKLLTATIEQGKIENCVFVWSYPRKTSWNAYANAGFILDSEWERSETSDENAYCIIKLN